MLEVAVIDIKSEIKKYLRKEPQRVVSEIEAHLTDAASLQLANQKLDQIRLLLEKQDEKDNLRKNLSRKIGQARKKNLDCQGLIEQVSQISEQIKAIEVKRNTAIEEIDALLATNHLIQSPAKNSPRHFNTVLSEHAAKDMSISLEDNDALWQNFVDSCDHATIYHDARWRQLIERNFSHKTYSIVCKAQDGAVLGVMPLTHLRSRIFGSFTISMPYFNYGGPLAVSEDVEERLMQYAAEFSQQTGCSHMEVRETASRDNWLASKKKVSMILALPKDNAQLDSQLGSKLRAQVKRAASHQMTTETGSMDLLHDFYAVYSRNMRDLGTPAYGKKFFVDILTTFPAEAFITVVKKDGKPLAAGFLIGYNDKLEIPWASSLRKHNHLGANMLLYREILKQAISREYQYFDFGRSTRDANTYRFKKQWGATEHPLFWHYWTANNELPQINPDNPKYKFVIAVWKNIPVAITNLMGPLIARNLP